MIDELVDMGYDGVILTGGEPTMSPLLKPALKYASKRGLFSRMITNGHKLADPRFAKDLAEVNIGAAGLQARCKSSTSSGTRFARYLPNVRWSFTKWLDNRIRFVH